MWSAFFKVYDVYIFFLSPTQNMLTNYKKVYFKNTHLFLEPIQTQEQK